MVERTEGPTYSVKRKKTFKLMETTSILFSERRGTEDKIGDFRDRDQRHATSMAFPLKTDSSIT